MKIFQFLVTYVFIVSDWELEKYISKVWFQLKIIEFKMFSKPHLNNNINIQIYLFIHLLKRIL